MSGTVPEKIKMVHKMNVVRCADGVKPGVHITGAAKTFDASVKRGEESGEED